MSLTRARFANGQLGVDIRDNPTDRWERHNFTRVLRRMRSGRYEKPDGNLIWIRPRDIYVLPRAVAGFDNSMNTIYESGVITALFFTSISPQRVRVRQLICQRLPNQSYSAVARPEYSLNVQRFMGDIFHRRLEVGLDFTARISIVVVILSGMALGAAMGPAAGTLFGPTTLGAAVPGTAAATAESVIVGGTSAAIVRFIKENQDAMITAVRQDPQNGAAHFYRARTTNFKRILMNTFIAGASNAATSLIPGPRNCTTFELYFRTITDRMANAFAGVVQGIVEQLVSGDYRRLTEQQIRQGIGTSFIRDVYIRMFR